MGILCTKKDQLLCSSKLTLNTNKGHGVKCSVVKFTKPTVYVVEITEMKKNIIIKVCAVKISQVHRADFSRSFILPH